MTEGHYNWKLWQSQTFQAKDSLTSLELSHWQLLCVARDFSAQINSAPMDAEALSAFGCTSERLVHHATKGVSCYSSAIQRQCSWRLISACSLRELLLIDLCLPCFLTTQSSAAHQNKAFKVYGAYVVSLVAAIVKAEVKAEHLLVVTVNSNLWEYTQLRQRNISFLSTQQQ